MFTVCIAESTPISVTGEKGGNVTLTCECEANEILDIILSSRSENIHVCQNEECSGRVFKKGNCHIIIKDLRLNDAGKYFVNVYYRNSETELERQIRTYQLHIDDEISVKIGEELKLDVLLPDVDKSGASEQKKHRVDGARDAGTYRVLEPDKEILITVKVRVSKEKLDDTDKGKTDDTKYYRYWIGLTVVLVLLALILTAASLHTRLHRGAPPVGTATIPVSGQKGSNVTLPCQFKARKISDISLNSRSENIPVCQTEECSGRVFKQGNCDVIIKDLSFSDAGTYFLRVYYNNDQTKLKQQFRTYQLHIYDEISVKTGEEHKLDVLSNANQVVHWAKNKTRWRELWSKSNGAQSDQLTDSDGTLTIKEFTDNDAGTYRVLDNEGEILITVTVRASDTKSNGKRYTNDDKTDDTQQHSLLVLALIMLPDIKKQFPMKRGL
ncbi:Carcinoembryonic antigen-related cell adhesion molecule 1 [Labeo rohita]|uniref:Carcinoembryonic antigen-related cell adhesion molecule 1 n=1 Tax=Labeo rohita TaxID=84645 RepID=A0ABQ8LRK4_LABRO|nr:Carcinoembryonic antigen-related cell adhesion molecule 1 [Labeo rohita]